MARNYTMGKRAEERDRTRKRILKATMELHDEKGVAPTTFADIATRAGVGQATVSRHFPTYGDLIRACGGHVWQEMRPPVPETAPKVFADARGTSERIALLVEEVDAFYARGAHRLNLASRDRDLLPELHGFLSAVEAGVAALVTEALAPDHPPPHVLDVAIAMMSFRVWQSLDNLDLTPDEFSALRRNLLQCGLKAARSITIG